MAYLHQSGLPEQLCLKDMHFSGNVIPHSWYYSITNSRGHPDSNAILILAEIVYWYRSSSQGNKHKFYGNSLQLGYEHFETKFNFSRDQVRNALKKLEELKLVYRSFKTETKFGSTFSNIMFLDLNTEELVNITKNHKSEEVINEHFLEEDASKAAFSQAFTTDSNIVNQKNLPPISNFATPSSEISKDIDKEYKEKNYKNRYLDKKPSNFVNFSLNEHVETSTEQLSVDKTIKLDSSSVLVSTKLSNRSILHYSKLSPESTSTNIKPGSTVRSFPISHFLPLEEVDILTLTRNVGKEFGKTFINALAQKLSSKYPDHKFKSKEIFLNYMVKALRHEKHDAFKVNNINFAYSCPEESYLESIESSNDISDVGLIKRRIAQEFEAKLATNILKKCYFPAINEGMSSYKVYINDKSFKLEATTQEKIEKIIIEITQRTELASNETSGVGEVLFVQGKLKPNTAKDENIEPITLNQIAEVDLDIHPIWRKVKERLREQFDPGIYKSWISKIKFRLEGEGAKVVLIFPTKFTMEYFENSYGICSSSINRLLRLELTELQEIVHEVEGINYSHIIWLSEESEKRKKIDTETISQFTNFIGCSSFRGLTPAIALAL